MVAFIDDDIVEFILAEKFQRFAHRDVCGKNEVGVRLFMGAAVDTIAYISTENVLKGLQGSLKDCAFSLCIVYCIAMENARYRE